MTKLEYQAIETWLNGPADLFGYMIAVLIVIIGILAGIAVI